MEALTFMAQTSPKNSEVQVISQVEQVKSYKNLIIQPSFHF